MTTTRHVMSATRYVSFLLIGVLCLSLRVNQGDAKPARTVFTVRLREVTPLEGLVRFASENHVPVGIIISQTNGLCGQFKNIDLDGASVEQVLNAMIPSPEYIWSKEGEVFVIGPSSLPETSRFLLQLRLDRFSSMSTTIQGLGIILSSRIYGLLHPGAGYAGNIVSPVDAEKINPFTLDNVNVEQTANYIVSLGNRGLWILYPVPGDHQHIADIPRLYTFGYADDGQVLSKLSCSNPQNPPESSR